MAEITDRLAGVPHDDLPPASMESVRRRAGGQRNRQRWAAGSALAVLLTVVLMGPGLMRADQEIADAPTTMTASDTPLAPTTMAASDTPVATETTAMADAPPGVLAVWHLEDPDAVTSASTTLDLLVTRVECASAFTGEVLSPQVTVSETEISIRTEVEWIDMGGVALCPGNPHVPVTVELSEPIGDRVLVDEGCLRFDTTSHCTDGGIRWRP